PSFYDVFLDPVPLSFTAGVGALLMHLVKRLNLLASVDGLIGQSRSGSFAGSCRSGLSAAGCLLEAVKEGADAVSITACDRLIQQQLPWSASKLVRLHQPLMPARIAINLA